LERARSEKNIILRKNKIISTCHSAYKKVGYNGINLDKIASESGITRPTLYKYFNNKEDILLLILENEITLFTEELQKEFAVKKKYDVSDIVKKWVETVKKYSDLLSLYSLSFTVLEEKASYENLKSYKKSGINNLYKIEQILNRLFPDVETSKLSETVVIILATISGLYTATQLTEKQESILSELNGDLNLDFKELLTTFLYGTFKQLHSENAILQEK